MCYLTTVSKKKSATGYKMVAERKGKRYSLAMGFCYDDYDRIPIIREQKKIGLYFNDHILTLPMVFQSRMEGRTAIFINKEDAITRFRRFKAEGCKPGFSIKLYKAVVSIDLMEGYYNDDYPVIAGRKIKFIEEVN